MKITLKSLFTMGCVACLSFCASVQAEDATENAQAEAIKVAAADGEIQGQVFTMLEDVKTPLLGNVSLKDSEGNTISTLTTDVTGKFSFKDVEPGRYQAIAVSGDYIGDTEIEVGDGSEEVEGVYTSIPLAVAQPTASAIVSSYGAMPAAQFSSAPISYASAGGCSTCSSSCGGGCGGGAVGGCGGGCGGGFGGGLLGGGGNFRRLALLGTAVAIPVALSGGNDDDASPAEMNGPAVLAAPEN